MPSRDTRFRPLLFALFAVAVVVTLVMALLPHPPSPLGTIWDKWQHMLAFGSLALLAAFAFPTTPLLLIGQRLSFFGALIELTQALPMIRRDCDIFDWVADTIAFVIVLLVIDIAMGGTPFTPFTAFTLGVG